MTPLKRYSVIVTRDTTESTTVEVEAETPEAAEEMARGQSYTGGYIWEQDDTPNASKDHYTNGADEIEEASSPPPGNSNPAELKLYFVTGATGDMNLDWFIAAADPQAALDHWNDILEVQDFGPDDPPGVWAVPAALPAGTLEGPLNWDDSIINVTPASVGGRH